MYTVREQDSTWLDMFPFAHISCFSHDIVLVEKHRENVGFCRLIANGGEPKAAWVNSDATPADQILASAMDEMQVKCSQLDVQNARLQVDLVSAQIPANAILVNLLSTVDSHYKRTFEGHPKGCLYWAVAFIERIC